MMFASDRAYRTALRQLQKQAAHSRLAQTDPGTATHYAEVIAKEVDRYGVAGWDRHALRDVILDYAGRIDLEVKLTGDRFSFRRRATRHARTR
jgi:hypothetical protein